MILKAGRNLHPQDIEELASQIEGVRRGCVAAFGVNDRRSGTERLVVVFETRLKGQEAKMPFHVQPVVYRGSLLPHYPSVDLRESRTIVAVRVGTGPEGVVGFLLRQGDDGIWYLATVSDPITAGGQLALYIRHTRDYGALTGRTMPAVWTDLMNDSALWLDEPLRRPPQAPAGPAVGQRRVAARSHRYGAPRQSR